MCPTSLSEGDSLKDRRPDKNQDVGGMAECRKGSTVERKLTEVNGCYSKCWTGHPLT